MADPKLPDEVEFDDGCAGTLWLFPSMGETPEHSGVVVRAEGLGDIALFYAKPAQAREIARTLINMADAIEAAGKEEA